MNLLSIFDWKTWLILIIVIIALFWLFYGGNRDIEFVGLKPLYSNSNNNILTNNNNNNNSQLFNNNNNEIPAAGRSKIENRTDIVFTDLIQKIGGDISKIQRNVRLPNIINPETGRRLEFDIYYENGNDKIAVEVDGRQHTEFPNSFHADTPEGKKAFEAQKRRDFYKEQAAEDNNICLIRVPYYIANGVNKNENYIGIKSPAKREKIREFLTKALNYCFGAGAIY